MIRVSVFHNISLSMFYADIENVCYNSVATPFVA